MGQFGSSNYCLDDIVGAVVAMVTDGLILFQRGSKSDSYIPPGLGQLGTQRQRL